MEAEKLKVIAEGMGYETERVKSNAGCDWVDIIIDGYIAVKYSPLTNNDQMVEIMERLLDIESVLEVERSLALDNTRFVNGCSGKTINEAVCNAAYEHFK